MDYSYKTKGTCSVQINFSIDEDGKLHDVVFLGGCNGNLKGIGRLVEGEDAKAVAEKIEGTTCGPKPTSCPDQLAKAIRSVLEN